MKTYLSAMAFALLCACSGNPLDSSAGGGGGGGGGGSQTLDVPAEISRDVQGASYNAAKGTLKVQLVALDSTPIVGTFQRRKGLDLAGYDAFALQETNTQRSFLAYFKKSGSVSVGAVSDGGQFVNTLGGGTYQRDGVYSQPVSGLATYEGGYVGLLNIGNQDGDLDPVTPLRVVGNARINADFTNGAVNGGVANRRIVNGGAVGANIGPELDPIGLEITEINANGTFKGSVLLGKTGAGTPVGSYAGLFGGKNANDVGVTLFFKPLKGPRPTETGVIAIHCVKKPKGVPCK